MKHFLLILNFVCLFILPILAEENSVNKNQEVINFNNKTNLVSMTFTGDMMMATDYPYKVLPPNDGRTFFNSTKDFFKADILVGNYEGTMTNVKNSPKAKLKGSHVYAFRTPQRYAKYYKAAGFDVLSVANNHALDFGLRGNRETVKFLEAQGIKVTGPAKKLAIIERQGIKVGFLGYCWYSQFNDLRNISAAKNFIAQCKTKVDILVIYFHGGAEGSKASHVPQGNEIFYGKNRGNTRAFCHAAITAGADLVIGHGPHVLRGTEWYKGKLIAYSLGNFATYGRFSLNYPKNISSLLNVTMTKNGKLVKASITPIILKQRGIPQYDEKKYAFKIMNTLSRQDFKTPALFDANGQLILPTAIN